LTTRIAAKTHARDRVQLVLRAGLVDLDDALSAPGRQAAEGSAGRLAQE
jgi:hypothetical protein